jgi:hypothetical protein
VDVDIVDKAVTLKQRSVNSSDTTTKWTIPLFAFDHNTKTSQLYLLLKDGSVCSPRKVDLNPGTILNYKGFSFSAIQYSAAYWKDLLLLDYSQIDEQTIYGLLMDLGNHRNLGYLFIYTLDIE